MWFDAKARLAEIRTAAATGAHSRPAPAASPAPEAGDQIARIARIARPRPAEPENAPASDPDDCRYGFAFDGSPRTWRGTIVSLEEWRDLTEWQRHGPNGRMFCGKCWRYREPETALTCLDWRPCR